MHLHLPAALLLAATLPAQICLDQRYQTQRANGLEITGNQSAAQTFPCTRAGLLTRVDVDVRHWVSGVTTALDVNLLTTDASGVPTSTVLATAQLQASEIPVNAYAMVAVRFAAAPAVQAGQVLAVELSVPSTVARAYAWSGDAPGAYAAGTTFIRRNVGPLSFDMGFATYVGAPASATGYGSGFPGSNGIPTLTAAPPVLGTTIALQLGSSAPSTVQGALLVGTARASTPTPFGGTLLVVPLLAINVSVPAAGASLPVAVPDDPSLCGQSVVLQEVLLDSGAALGVAFSAGLDLIPGA